MAVDSKKIRRGSTVFVTVGTTLFESLVEGVLTEKVLNFLVQHGYRRLVIQYGKGVKPNHQQLLSSSSSSSKDPLEIECYDFKPSLANDMQDADLIISHAGAGTVMECLRLKKRLVVVINTKLMHNHQTELASAMGTRGHLYVVPEPQMLQDMQVWREIESFVPVAKKPGDPYNFPTLLDSFMGFNDDNADSSNNNNKKGN